MKKIFLYFHTVKYLKTRQVLYRVWYKLKKPKFKFGKAAKLKNINPIWVKAAERSHSIISSNEFTFLGVSGSLKGNNWEVAGCDKLWNYNLHYFDDLNARHSSFRREWQKHLVNKWISDNLPGEGVGWEPYPTSLRIVNWLKWRLSGVELTENVVSSLAVQSNFLMQRLEFHLLGNHLFANAKALVFSGLLIEDEEAPKWFNKGAEIILNELSEQVLKDGGHFELSPMYHSLAIEDILDLINLLRSCGGNNCLELLTELEGQVIPMLNWLAALSHPDNRISFFNDAAFGIAPDNSEIFKYANRLGYKLQFKEALVRDFPDSGYVRGVIGPAVLLADLADVGPTYLPGHAHADTLSFELSIFKERVIVNSGTSLYGDGEERIRQRGTSAHSTLVINGQNSSEVWSGFRVARRAKIVEKKIVIDNSSLFITGVHDGYERLQKKMFHKRTWSLNKHALRIEDSVSERCEAYSIFHVHPEITIFQEDERSGYFLLNSDKVVRWASNTIVILQHGTWHPRFGVRIPNQHLKLNLMSKNVFLELRWD